MYVMEIKLLQMIITDRNVHSCKNRNAEDMRLEKFVQS